MSGASLFDLINDNQIIIKGVLTVLIVLLCISLFYFLFTFYILGYWYHYTPEVVGPALQNCQGRGLSQSLTNKKVEIKP